jgi:hypothetical protein
MICCLPFWPGKAWVSRIDWMISFSFRSPSRPSPWTSSSSSSRWRTSCWVIVEAPRGLPRMASIPEATIAAGSKPVFVQKLLSSTAVVASMRTFGISSNDTSSRCSSPKRPSSRSPLRS